MESYEEQYTRLLNEIEKLARSFLEAKFNSLQELWDIEIALVNYQSGLWKAIDSEQAIQQEAKRKKAEIVSTKRGEWIPQAQQLDAKIKQADDRIKIYQHAHQLSRQLGDAFAWGILGDWLLPLTKKPSGPTHDGHNLPKDHGLTGMLAIAQSLSAVGAGFPILHDITNCLCIGDITFYSPDKDHSTIEVKTHLKDQSEGNLTLDVETHIIALKGSNDINKWRIIDERIPKSPSFSDKADERVRSQYSNQQSPRKKRQIERMGEAKVWQSTPVNQVCELANHSKGITIDYQPDETTHNWQIVRELIIKARVDGIASCAVDNALVYVVIYQNSPLTYPWSKDPLKSIVRSSDKVIADTFSILYSEKEKNRLWIPNGSCPLDVIPFFLYSLPIDMIIDIMWGRLSIGVVANLGKIVAALEATGLEVKLPKDEKDFGQFFLPMSAQRVLPDGRIIQIELHQMRDLALKMFYEFLSLPGFVRLMSKVVKNLEEHVSKNEEQEI